MNYKSVIKLVLFLIFIFSILFILIGMLAPICANLGCYKLADKFYFLLSNLCHQQPTRTFLVGKYSLAICSRCFGFYIACGVFSSLILVKNINFNSNSFFLIVYLVVIDILLNVIFAINTGILIRFIVGVLLGFIFVQIFNFVLSKGEKI